LPLSGGPCSCPASPHFAKQHFRGRKHLLLSWVGRTACLGGSAGGLEPRLLAAAGGGFGEAVNHLAVRCHLPHLCKGDTVTLFTRVVGKLNVLKYV